MGIFSFLGSLLGWILGYFINICNNYTIAVILFAAVLNFVNIPFTIKNLKLAPQRLKFTEKQRELRKFCGRDTKKYNDELMKLYENENFNPMSGILTMIAPIVLLFCMYFTVSKPLEHILHLPKSTLASAYKVLSEDSAIAMPKNERYQDLFLIRNFESIKTKMTMFSEDEICKIENLKSEFMLGKLNLLEIPKTSESSTFLWIIPVLAFFLLFASTFVLQRINPTIGKMNFFTLIFNPLFFAWTIYISPAALGVYWIFNNLFYSAQNAVFSKIYNKFSINAKEEFERFKLLTDQELSFSKQE